MQWAAACEPVRFDFKQLGTPSVIRMSSMGIPRGLHNKHKTSSLFFVPISKEG